MTALFAALLMAAASPLAIGARTGDAPAESTASTVGAPASTSPADPAETADPMTELYPEWESYPDHAKRALMRAPDPNIAEMLTKIDKTDVQMLFAELESRSKPNRLTGTSRYADATEWIRGVLNTRAPRLDVAYQEWGTYRNVIISLPGDGSNTDWYEVGGHYDSVSAGPGMDDDGSGSLGSAIIALAMAEYNFQANVRFLLFDAEESGLIGSQHYVQELKNTCAPKTCLKYYINMDMMAYDPSNQRKFYSNTAKVYLQDIQQKVITDYLLNTGIVRGGQQGCNTDHCFYDRNGYDSVSDDEITFSRCYHQACDLIAEFNWDTMLETFRTVAGTLATSAGILGKANQSKAVSLELTPQNASVALDKSLQFRAKGLDANGTPAPLPSPVKWNASGGSISSNGLFTPAALGNYTVTATSGNLSATTNLQVTPSQLSRVEIQPRDPIIREDQTILFTATGYDGQGQAIVPQPKFTWASTVDGLPKGEVTVDGQFTPDGPGSYVVKASTGPFSDISIVTVKKLEIASLTITPGCLKDCQVGVEYPISAVGKDAAGAEVQFTNGKHGAQFTWKVTAVKPANGDFGVVMQNMPDWYYIPPILGVVKIQATGFGVLSNEVELTIVPGVLAKIVLDPEPDQKVEGGKTVAFKVSKAEDANGNQFLPDYKSRLSFKWTVNPPALGTLEANAEENGTFTALKKGSGSVVVEVTDSNGQVKKTDSTNVEVTSDKVVEQPPQPETPSASFSGMIIPVAAITAVAVAAILGYMLMRRRRQSAVKQEASGAKETKPAEAPKPVAEKGGTPAKK